MRFAVSFLTLFCFWIILSGNFDAFHLTLGLASTLIVTFWTGDMLVLDGSLSMSQRLGILWRFSTYSIWLLYQILLANLHVVYVALHPQMEKLLEPQMIEFKSYLKTDLEKFILANSITLTPGTVTVRIEGDVFLVHALTRQAAEGVPGEMEDRVARIFRGCSHA